MFWKVAPFSASSPVEAILDKENFTLEELLDDEEIIQECRALNSRLINFLRERDQVEKLLRYIVEEPPEDGESNQTFRFPFIACEIFTCEIDVILRTLADDVELMDLLFSFLEPKRPHSAQLAGYFSKVVICLMLRKTIPLMNYVKAHQYVICQLVDLIGVTSIMEVLLRLVGGDDHVYPNYMDVMQWLADSNLLEMIVDKLSPSSPTEVQANAAETLCALTRNSSSILAAKLSSESFVARIFGHALEDSNSRSALIHSLSVCISLLDAKASLPSSMFYSYQSQYMYVSPSPVKPETIGAMLPKLGDMLKLLSFSSEEKILPTTYGELRPPLGKHRLKIVEFVAVLLKSGNEVAEKELISSGTIQRVLDLFFEYPFNSALHHHVYSIILSCLESKNNDIVIHLFRDCNLIEKILQTDKHPLLFSDADKPTISAAGKRMPRAGNLGHITRISNKLVHLGSSDNHIQAILQESNEWCDWKATVLQERNMVENVRRWACGRPTALQDRMKDSDEEDLHDKDYDVAALANNLSQAFGYDIYDNQDAGQSNETLEREDEGIYYDKSAEVVVSSHRIGDEQGSSLFSNDWFASQDNDSVEDDAPMCTSSTDIMDETNPNGGTSGDTNCYLNDEAMVGDDEKSVESASVTDIPLNTEIKDTESDSINKGSVPEDEKASASGDTVLSQSQPPDEDMGESSDAQVGCSSKNPFEEDPVNSNSNLVGSEVTSCVEPVESDSGQKVAAAAAAAVVPSLFEEDVEFVGVELEGTEKAMDHALKEGIVGEAGPLKRNINPNTPEKEGESEPGLKEFNDANYWKVDGEVKVAD